jgi:hypothetical protein
MNEVFPGRVVRQGYLVNLGEVYDPVGWLGNSGAFCE